MKNFSILFAMLFLAFTVQAQNAERSKRAQDKKSTKSSVKKTSGNSSRAKVAQVPSSSKSRNSQSSSVALRSSSNRNTKYSSSSSLNEKRESKYSPSSSSIRKVNRNDSKSDYASNSRSSSRVSSSSSKAGQDSRSSRVNEKQDGLRMSSRKVFKTPGTSINNSSPRKVYTRNMGTKVHRQRSVANHYIPQSLAYKRVHHPFYKPRVADLFWSAKMYRDYRRWYPDFRYEYYPFGYRIHTVSAYDAYKYIGEVARVYGVVNEVWYSRESREYYLYIGAPYPHQDFTIILESSDAKRYSWDPIRYFTHRQLAVSGLVSLFEQKPEMLIRKRSQINLY